MDDFTQSSINACAQTCESPKPHTVDILCSMCLALMKISDGSLTWEARSFDLKRAYRQCAIHPEHDRYSYIAVANPQDKRVRCFRMKALPFGSVMSVLSFLRISHSLWAILASIFGVFISNYFDDFVALATSCETQSVTAAVTLTFKMLGWIFAETGEKNPAVCKPRFGPWCDSLCTMYPSFIAAVSRSTTLKTGNQRLQPPSVKSLTQAHCSGLMRCG